ncbi:unnamed protein product [Caenorhabditis bovis]|uniref:Dehydrogenase/reductase SDR family member 1 n=1 Tax=Caenorhabditis bovis TaxID=2654633 RepID=A0A8S1EGX0_9PELO|nr:unnamed protein product [Caenorhabditis bovis]
MSLSGKYAIVTGASRGCGRGIALQLAEAGCIVFITGRKPNNSLSSKLTYLPTLQDTAEECRKRGGECHPFYVDHSNMDEVEKFFEEVSNITNGKLHILVNNAYSAVTKCGSGNTQKFYEREVDLWDEVNNVGLRNHYYCSVYGARMMANTDDECLIINVSSLGGILYLFNVPYGAGKMAIDRMSADMALELQNSNITVVSIWPGAVRTELIINMLENDAGSWGKTENEMFIKGESIEYPGKAVVAIASDPKHHKLNGATLITSDLGAYYNFKDIDGRIPTNLRSLKGLLMLAGYHSLATWCPEWFKLPGWAITVWQNKIRS